MSESHEVSNSRIYDSIHPFPSPKPSLPILASSQSLKIPFPIHHNRKVQKYTQSHHKSCPRRPPSSMAERAEKLATPSRSIWFLFLFIERMQKCPFSLSSIRKERSDHCSVRIVKEMEKAEIRVLIVTNASTSIIILALTSTYHPPKQRSSM